MSNSIRCRAAVARRRLRLTPLLWAVLLAIQSGCGDGITAPSPGSLAVTITGLPASVQSGVMVTGPNAYSAVIASSSTLTALPPGTSTVSARGVMTGGVRYDATPATQNIVVASGVLARASGITYTVATARLTVTILGLPTGVHAGVAVAGPNGYARTLAISTLPFTVSFGRDTASELYMIGGTRVWRIVRR
jgi:hypothetical protein